MFNENFDDIGDKKAERVLTATVHVLNIKTVNLSITQMYHNLLNNFTVRKAIYKTKHCK